VAVASRPHALKGEVPVAFVLLRAGEAHSDEICKELIKTVDVVIGPTARPNEIVFVDNVPKTRSGKIMWRLLKSLVRHEPLGDISTLVNPESVDELKKTYRLQRIKRMMLGNGAEWSIVPTYLRCRVGRVLPDDRLQDRVVWLISGYSRPLVSFIEEVFCMRLYHG
jgi:hypothetical protein